MESYKQPSPGQAVTGPDIVVQAVPGASNECSWTPPLPERPHLLPDFSDISEKGLCPGSYTYVHNPDLPPEKGAKRGPDRRLQLGAETRSVFAFTEKYAIFMCWGLKDRWAVVSAERGDDGGFMLALPLDSQYFEIVLFFNEKYNGAILRDILDFYVRMRYMPSEVDMNLVAYINVLAMKYPEPDRLAILFAYMHLYYGYVAEDFKQNTYVGRLIKMNAVCDILTGRMSIKEAIDYTNSKPGWREIRDFALLHHGILCPWTYYGDCAHKDLIAGTTGYIVGPDGRLVSKRS